MSKALMKREFWAQVLFDLLGEEIERAEEELAEITIELRRKCHSATGWRRHDGA
jgi:hypothetical protein